MNDDCVLGRYELRGVIGEGAFSVVRLAYQPEENRFYACKIISKARLQANGLENRFENEIRVNQQLNHPGVVKNYELFQDENNYYVIMEFCQNGELFQYIVQRGQLEERVAKIFIKQILEALQYIHSMAVCHRDLKPENLLLDDAARVKISDFGLSRFVGPNNLVSTPCGSPCYASPECISGRNYSGKSSDIWSVGVISYAMLTGQLPWTKRNQQQLFEQIRKGEYLIPGYLSETCTSFIHGLMTVDPQRRLTITQALQHPWLWEVPDALADTSVILAPYPSLRQLDCFFGREISFETIPTECLQREESLPQFPKTEVAIEKLSRQLVGKRPPPPMPRTRIYRRQTPFVFQPQAMGQLITC